MNSPYQTPQTNSEFKRKSAITGDPNKWSSKTVCILTFLPMALCLATAVLMQLDEDFFFVALFVAPISGFIIALMTAFNFHEQSKGLVLLGHVVLWLVVHTALIGLGFFGCVTIMMG